MYAFELSNASNSLVFPTDTGTIGVAGLFLLIGANMDKKGIIKYIVQDWNKEENLAVTKCQPGQEVLWLQNNLNVPSHNWTKIPENINILPIPEILYHPDDFSWAGPPRDGELEIPPPGIIMDDENKIIFVIVSDYKDVLAYYMFTYEILPVKGF